MQIGNQTGNSYNIYGQGKYRGKQRVGYTKSESEFLMSKDSRKERETEETFQIGAQTFTVEEWKEFLDKFDSMQEVLKVLMKERHAKLEAEREEREKRMDEIEEKEQEEEYLQKLWDKKIYFERKFHHG